MRDAVEFEHRRTAYWAIRPNIVHHKPNIRSGASLLQPSYDSVGVSRVALVPPDSIRSNEWVSVSEQPLVGLAVVNERTTADGTHRPVLIHQVKVGHYQASHRAVRN